MKQKLRKGLSLTLFLLGLFIFATAPMNVTGAVIGISDISTGLGSVLGIVLMFAALMVFTAHTKVDPGLETLVDHTSSKYLTQVEEEAKYNSTILDANYIIDACKDTKEYKKLGKLIKTSYDTGHPLILPEEVRKELKIKTQKHKDFNESAEDRKKIFLNNLSKFTFDLSEERQDYSGEIKKEYVTVAENILKNTPKFLGFKYASQINTGIIDEDAFLRKEKINNFDSLIFKVFDDSEIKDVLKKIRRNYDKDSHFSTHTYDIARADIEVLANALYLSDYPDILAGKEIKPIHIFSSDTHLSQANKVINKKFPDKKDQIYVRTFN